MEATKWREKNIQRSQINRKKKSNNERHLWKKKGGGGLKSERIEMIAEYNKEAKTQMKNKNNIVSSFENWKYCLNAEKDKISVEKKRKWKLRKRSTCQRDPKQ